jgi:hypothetical protein
MSFTLARQLFECGSDVCFDDTLQHEVFAVSITFAPSIFDSSRTEKIPLNSGLLRSLAVTDGE